MSATDWTTALDELEREVERAEHLAVTSAVEQLAEWVPPTGIGPLPHHLVARARALADRQQAVIARLEPLLRETRQQLQVSRRIAGSAARTSAPVYVDVTA
jgi:hypothetical protein